jgi:hypothetical protein
MALTIDIATDRVISLSEYLEYVETNCDPDDDDSVCESANMLLALANNRTFIAERITQELLAWQSFQLDNSYTSQTLEFGRAGRFSVRANIWEPPPVTSSDIIRAWHDKLHYYLVPHDHTFKFLTVGYHGSGYATSIYEIEPDRVSGRTGDLVSMRLLEHTTLPKGKVMFYRARRDVHVQAHPAEFSVSLNLLVQETGGNVHDQHFFDLERSTIASVPMFGSNASRILMCRLARHFGDDSTTPALEEIAAVHPAHRVRAEAYAALVANAQGSAQRLWQRALSDVHPFVKKTAHAALTALEGGRISSP